MAPTGQESAQKPHPMHRSGVRTGLVWWSRGSGRPRSRQLTGHAWTQAMHETQREFFTSGRPVFALRPHARRSRAILDGRCWTDPSTHATLDTHVGINRVQRLQVSCDGSDGADACAQTTPDALLVDEISHVPSCVHVDEVPAWPPTSGKDMMLSSIPSSCNV